jgi:hypothetical protein
MNWKFNSSVCDCDVRQNMQESKSKKKVKLSPYQAVEAYRIVRC